MFKQKSGPMISDWDGPEPSGSSPRIVAEIVASIRRDRGRPWSARDDYPRGAYCVGGAASMSFRRGADAFPSVGILGLFLRDELGVERVDAFLAAKHIVEANDLADFELAWKWLAWVLERADASRLVLPAEDGPWFQALTPVRLNIPRLPSMDRNLLWEILDSHEARQEMGRELLLRYEGHVAGTGMRAAVQEVVTCVVQTLSTRSG